ncbi:4-hydroxy-tetrahydrodipicolinate reductase [Halosquirtibacter xylanolyticus]|uniref:4-hydroxy-tetrahydrodipicolinate reductase n=1 Tax=Halosquirtibacter xylanolyticus TaxID=3374599 RepID=UPI0037496652|nr:4-hydroxy-tetrahydrodipicolinate reductase [Prolixibacteraceae bacterium]
MKIALIGYGKMGKTIEKICLDRGHEIALVVDEQNANSITSKDLEGLDVAIEFTNPASAVKNYNLCFDAGVPVVSGTTGWLDQEAAVIEQMKAKDGTFFYASNFSLGVNLFFELNKKLGQMMNRFPDYDVDMVEVHHTQKLDAPSGTAITLAEGIFETVDRKTSWTLDAPKEEQLHIEAERRGDVPGIHTVKYESEVDEIVITHSAKSRQGFAFGAVLAAEFAFDKKGALNMRDLLNL